MQSEPLVSMVIVNYNSGELLRRCLESVRIQTYPKWEVIIVDNASHDASLRTVEGLDRITIVRNNRNVGFAAGQNQGMRQALGRYLMPLNFDIEMTPQFLDHMVAAIESSPSIGTVTGKLMQMGEEAKRLDLFYSTGHLMPPNRFPLHRGAGERDCGQYDQIEEVFGAPGAAPLYRREMLEDVAFQGQYFDESFFTWYEDVDLDWRAQWRGWKCLYTPWAVAYHRGHPEGLGRNLKHIAISIRNRWLMIAADECMVCASRNAFALIGYELGLLRYVVRANLPSAYAKALWSFVHLLPLAQKKRQHIRKRAVVNCPFRDAAEPRLCKEYSQVFHLSHERRRTDRAQTN